VVTYFLLLVYAQTLRLEVDAENGDYFDDDEWCVDALGISRLASCLPALDFLSLTNVVKDVDTVAALTQLMPGLTQLFVAGIVFDNNAAGFVAGLTSLRELDWSNSELTSVGLQALTALTNLDMLLVEYWPELNESDSEGFYDDEVKELELYTSQEVRGPSVDVWSLLTLLEASRCRACDMQGLIPPLQTAVGRYCNLPQFTPPCCASQCRKSC
jgi:hypothetical protein